MSDKNYVGIDMYNLFESEKNKYPELTIFYRSPKTKDMNEQPLQTLRYVNNKNQAITVEYSKNAENEMEKTIFFKDTNDKGKGTKIVSNDDILITVDTRNKISDSLEIVYTEHTEHQETLNEKKLYSEQNGVKKRQYVSRV